LEVEPDGDPPPTRLRKAGLRPTVLPLPLVSNVAVLRVLRLLLRTLAASLPPRVGVTRRREPVPVPVPEVVVLTVEPA
jgi:hypothetical protein